MKITNQNIANFYGVSLSTVKNYKRAKVEKRLLYEAMVEYFKKENSNKTKQKGLKDEKERSKRRDSTIK